MSSWQIHRSIPLSSLSIFETTKCIYVVIKILYTDKIINWKNNELILSWDLIFFIASKIF